ncbi:hypothetical protein LZ30DRAFT_77205 [Colletotrichum cereale]|nr:hypothetical protein LZ30DRAFT_77205 [Colletotrichum cereale]
MAMVSPRLREYCTLLTHSRICPLPTASPRHKRIRRGVAARHAEVAACHGGSWYQPLGTASRSPSPADIGSPDGSCIICHRRISGTPHGVPGNGALQKMPFGSAEEGPRRGCHCVAPDIVSTVTDSCVPTHKSYLATLGYPSRHRFSLWRDFGLKCTGIGCLRFVHKATCSFLQALRCHHVIRGLLTPRVMGGGYGRVW